LLFFPQICKNFAKSFWEQPAFGGFLFASFKIYNRFAKTPHFSAEDEGKARFQASPEANNKAVESLSEKTLGFQPREAY